MPPAGGTIPVRSDAPTHTHELTDEQLRALHERTALRRERSRVIQDRADEATSALWHAIDGMFAIAGVVDRGFVATKEFQELTRSLDLAQQYTNRARVAAVKLGGIA